MAPECEVQIRYKGGSGLLTIAKNGVSIRAFRAFAFCILLGGCTSRQPKTEPLIEFNKVPPTGQGGPVPLVPITGHVKGARPDDKIVLFAKALNGIWWVQPIAIQPFTSLKSDSTWDGSTHLGTEYAALLVEPGFRPPATTDALPIRSGKVLAVATVKGVGKLVSVASGRIEFSGYEWYVVNAVSERNGIPHVYDASNVSTDSKGYLHLRIVRKADGWSCSQVILSHSLGYGTYLFSVEDVSHLDPATVLTLFTWDDLGAEQNHREMDVEISRWGDPAGQNAQFVVQPYYVPENVARFLAPPGPLTYSFQWEPAKVSFLTVKGKSQHDEVATHVFTSGIPHPGGESVSLNFCAFGFAKVPLKSDAEVTVDRFQYLP